MRVTIDQREAINPLGRINFYVDCTVQFSEAEKAVIRNRQLYDHAIVVGGDRYRFRSMTQATIALRTIHLIFIVSAFMILPMIFIVAIARIHGAWWFLTVFTAVGSFVGRTALERHHKKSIEDRAISLGDLMKQPKFTVYEDDAYLAGETEKSIVLQLNDLKNRMVAIAPGLAEQQVYQRE